MTDACSHRLFFALVALAMAFTAPASLHAQFRFSTVVIDAGHGGKDPGTIWYHRVEKHLALDVAKRVETGLRAKGIKTVMTRRTDTFVELDQRARLANKVPSSIFVSIHFNADGRDFGKNGAEMHYYGPKGLAIARRLDMAFDRSVKLGCRKLVQRKRLVVLRDTKAPAVLVECGYLTNRTNSWLCSLTSHRQAIANAIVAGILASRVR
ncbi:MAG: N-acetylmuramoyl-L-alanine amidase [Verrucomicrobiaceae bacterium]|jgi:N-acetylmuramoyl-L-alanine amidase|nr:N-acetylmuramoyl-L-alanine amidase [Verrucomicrobiaceae bacterium]